MNKMGPAQARQELIVRVSKLTNLNGSEVNDKSITWYDRRDTLFVLTLNTVVLQLRPRERIDTERIYLSRCLKTAMIAMGISTRDEWDLIPAGDKDKALSVFVRFNELAEIHGLPLPAKSFAAGTTLSSNNITVIFKSMAVASMTGDCLTSRCLPPFPIDIHAFIHTMTSRSIESQSGCQFRLPSNNTILTCLHT